ncbi:MAG: branched-chain amino acid ABC transporter permease [Burkholderiales bacterium]|nr:branched-chain amino acid ABC transporter permease [Burkholderiales bacterium]
MNQTVSIQKRPPAQGTDRTTIVLLAALVVLLVAGPLLPRWAMFMLNVSLSWGTVVLGMLLLMRTGLVSFGQGLYYCLGAYAAGALHHFYGIADIMVMLLASLALAAAVAAVLGLLLAKYRSIFFAMLSLAFSMILFGLLVKTSALGSTDGFGLSAKTLAGITLGERWERYALFATTVVVAFCAAFGVHRYLSSHQGRLAGAIRDNELRVEYMGASVRRVIHVNYVIAASLAGIGGGLVGISIGHVDPEMAFWTTSGEFVFIAILSGTGSVLAPFLGATIFESVRSFAYEYSPNTWQLILGVTMLLVIMFLPGGLWSVFTRRKAA